MSKTDTVSPLRQRMIEDMAARKLNPHTQRSHIQSCKRFAAWLKRLPDTATPDEVRLFQLYLIESGASICNRNRIMTGVRFLFRVTLRRHDLAAEVWHLKEPQKLPPVLSPEEVKRILSMATSLKARVMLTISYGCGLRAAGRRGGAAAGVRHRQYADDHPRRAVEGPQGPARDAAARGPRPVAAMVEGAPEMVRHRRCAGTALAVSRPQSSSAADHAPVRTAVQRSRESRRAAQDALSSFASPFLRDPSAGARQGHTPDSGVARTRQARDDGSLYPRSDRNDLQDRKHARGP
jgi:Phage integrase, N-terminal SAM-like domain